MQKKRLSQAHTGRAARRAVLAGLIGILFPVLLLGAGKKASTWHFPLDTTEWCVSDNYGKRADPFTGQMMFHHGMDLACAEGTAVLAVQDGVVTSAAFSESYGNFLCILHPEGCKVRYAHLQYLYVRSGEVVQAGQRIGTAGSTGRVTGPHLHLELWKNGAELDPAALL